MRDSGTSETKGTGIFVLSDVRSGSTLLDQCLGAHPEIMSLGEVHWLPAYIAQDRTQYDPEHPLVCSCGIPVGVCPFWSAVAKHLARPLAELRLRANLKSPSAMRGDASLLAWTVRRVVRRHPRLLRYEAPRSWVGADRMARDIAALFAAVTAVSGRPLCVDSSKSALRFRAVYALDPARSKALVLVRDFRAVVYSKMKRGLSFEAAALGWRRKMEEIRALTADLPQDAVHTLKYEDFCQQPDKELGKICQFLGVRFSHVMLERPRENVHHIGGSPSKFDESRSRIELDRTFERHFAPHQESELRRLIGSVAERWGY